MLTAIRALAARQQRFLSYCGDPPARDTYAGELNVASGEVFFITYLTLVVWLPYIASDLELHCFPAFVITCRVLLSVLSLALLLMKCTAPFRTRPGLLLRILITYVYISTALITATAGASAAAYIGGYTFVLLLPVFAPLSFRFKVALSVLSCCLFFVVGWLAGLAFSDGLVRYCVINLLTLLALSLVLAHNQDRLRRGAWRQAQEINAMMTQRERDLETIVDLAYSIEKASDARTEFLAHTSHEIRTPMNAILGMTELVLRQELSRGAREHVMEIKNAANNLLDIVNGLLDISKIESGLLELHPVKYRLASMFCDVCGIMRAKAAEKELQFTSFIDSNLPTALFGDVVRIRQVFLNLLDNAIKYTRMGFVAVELTGERRPDGIALRFVVTDSGIGIRPEDLDRLFDKFTQVDPERHQGIDGTGLGLTISRNLCRMMDGDILVESEYGKGSSFTVTLAQEVDDPARLAAVRQPGQASVLLYEHRPRYLDSISRTLENLGVPYTAVSKQSELTAALDGNTFSYVFLPTFIHEGIGQLLAARAPGAEIVFLTDYGAAEQEGGRRSLITPIDCTSVANILNHVPTHTFTRRLEATNYFTAPDARVLVVDDIPVNLKVAEGLLAPFEMRVDTCLSGEEAIERILRTEYDIVFMDHMMPGMDGIEAVGVIRTLGGAYDALPVVAMTASAVRGMREMFLSNGMNDYLAKPIEIARLNAILSNWLPKDKQRKTGGEETACRIPAALLAMEDVDVAAGIRNCGGDTAAYLETLRLFCRDTQRRVGEMVVCLDQGALRRFTTHVHGIKGAAANIGADRLSAAAAELETAGRAEDRQSLDENIQAFAALVRHTCDAIAPHLTEHVPPADTEDTARLLGDLDALKTAAQNLDIDAIDALIRHLMASRLRHTAAEIDECVLLCEYERAAELADAARETLLQQTGQGTLKPGPSPN